MSWTVYSVKPDAVRPFRRETEGTTSNLTVDGFLAGASLPECQIPSPALAAYRRIPTTIRRSGRRASPVSDVLLLQRPLLHVLRGGAGGDAVPALAPRDGPRPSRRRMPRCSSSTGPSSPPPSFGLTFGRRYFPGVERLSPWRPVSSRSGSPRCPMRRPSQDEHLGASGGSAGYFFSMVALLCLYRGLHSAAHARMVCRRGPFLGLAVGSRPDPCRFGAAAFRRSPRLCLAAPAEERIGRPIRMRIGGARRSPSACSLRRDPRRTFRLQLRALRQSVRVRTSLSADRNPLRGGRAAFQRRLPPVPAPPCTIGCPPNGAAISRSCSRFHMPPTPPGYYIVRIRLRDADRRSFCVAGSPRPARRCPLGPAAGRKGAACGVPRLGRRVLSFGRRFPAVLRHLDRPLHGRFCPDPDLSGRRRPPCESNGWRPAAGSGGRLSSERARPRPFSPSPFAPCSISSSVDLLRVLNPSLYGELAHIAATSPSPGLSGTPERDSVRLKSRFGFPANRAGGTEPLVTTGWEFSTDFLFVNYLDGKSLRIGASTTEATRCSLEQAGRGRLPGRARPPGRHGLALSTACSSFFRHVRTTSPTGPCAAGSK